jgi:hypothetical protein
MPGVRSDAVQSYVFKLDGVQCGFVKSVRGGDAVAEVIEERAGPSTYVKKHIGPPKYEDVALGIDFSLARSVYDWIAASWAMNYQRKDGSIVEADHTFTAKAERQFFDALLTEVTFPALDAASKEPGHLTIKLAPEYTKTAKASGKVTVPAAQKQKAWIVSNFRLDLDGLDGTKVSSIDSFTVKQAVAADDIGDARDTLKEPTKIEFPNLAVTLAEAGAATWEAWFDDFVLKGNNEDSKEKSGAIVFLAPDRKAELARVNLFNVGIFALRRKEQSANTDAVRRVTAGLYCERMELLLAGMKPPRILQRPAVNVRG